MKEKYDIHIDESGDPIFSENSSKYLVFSSIITQSEKTESICIELEKIKERYNLNEFKSNKISSEIRRINIFKDLMNLDFKVITLFVIKDKIVGDFTKNKKVFYKYTQKLLNSELHKLFNNKRVVLDRWGGDTYQASLKIYLDKQLNLFGDNLIIGTAKNEVLIQLADLFSGTFRKFYLEEFNNISFFTELFDKINLRTIIFPDRLSRLGFNDKYKNEDLLLAKTTISRAEKYVDDIKGKTHLQPQKIILEYLLFHVKYDDKKIFTPELIDWLKLNGYRFNSTEKFRAEVIGKLRDEGIIIAGSRNGIKIPVTNGELAEYISFSSNMVLPIISRLSKAYDILNSESMGNLNILRDENFKLLKELFKSVESYKIKG